LLSYTKHIKLITKAFVPDSLVINNALAFLVTPVGTTTGLTKGIEVPVTPATYNLCPAVGVAEYATIIGTAFVVGTLVKTTSSQTTLGSCV
jgi:hypothetical protein